MKLSMARMYLLTYGMDYSNKMVRSRLENGEILGNKEGNSKWDINKESLKEHIRNNSLQYHIALLVRLSKGEVVGQEGMALGLMAENADKLFGRGVKIEVGRNVTVFRANCQWDRLRRSDTWSQIKNGIRSRRFRFLVVQSFDRISRHKVKVRYRARLKKALGKYDCKLIVLDEALGLDPMSIEEIDAFSELANEVNKVGPSHPYFVYVHQVYRSRGTGGYRDIVDENKKNHGPYKEFKGF